MSDNPLTIARQERLALCDTFETVGPDAPTLCTPWTTRDLAAHLVVREGRPDVALGIWLRSLGERTGREQARVAAQPWPDLVEAVRAGPPAWHPARVPAVDNTSNLAEMVVHHEDVLRGDGLPGPRRVPSAHLEAAAWSLLTRTGRLLFRRVPAGVLLHSPGRESVTVSSGEAVVGVTGAPLELLLAAYGRRRVADIEVSGPDRAVAAFEAARLGLA